MYAVKKDADATTGGHVQSYDHVVRSIAQQTRSDRDVKEFVVGIASNGEKGLADRFNNKYKAMGYDEIKPVYQTSSDYNRKQMESKLVAHFDDHPKNENRVGGGGGPHGSGTMTVYVATKHYDAPPVHEGPRGGTYYYNSNGNAVYGAPSDGVYEGSRGGRYVYTSGGNKRYL
jgi:hypothetical protein